MAQSSGPNEFVREAYGLEDDAGRIDFYRKWAQDYDRQMLDELGYVSPTLIARLLSEYLPDTTASVFDIGCGTGLTCALLSQKGYTRLDGIDLSPEMVAVAGERHIYRELLVGDVNLELDRDDASYDAVISSGTFTHGHVGAGPLDEIFRILKPDGILACTVHLDLWESMGFRSKFDALVDNGSATCLDLHEDKYYVNGDAEGWYCIYRKNC